LGGEGLKRSLRTTDRALAKRRKMQQKRAVIPTQVQYLQSRQFQRETGLICIDYLTTIPVQKGLGLLRESVLPVAEIARQCRFSNGDYFCKAVLKATRHTPSAFRKL